MSKEYKAESMIKNSRHINYFNTLDKSIQNDVLKRIDELVAEEQEYCDKGNYGHLCNMLSLVEFMKFYKSMVKVKKKHITLLQKKCLSLFSKSKRSFKNYLKRVGFGQL